MNRSPQNPNQAYLLSTIFEKEEDVKENPFVFNKTAIGTKKAEYENYKFEGTLFKKGKDSEFELKERYFIYQENNLVSFKVSGWRSDLNKSCRIKQTRRKGVCSTLSTPDSRRSTSETNRGKLLNFHKPRRPQ